MDRSEHLARAARAIAQLPMGVAPSRQMLAELRYGWGNDFWSADLGYLEELARCAATASGPILECGSGATTLLLSALAAKRGVDIWTLEHLPEWYLSAVAALTSLCRRRAHAVEAAAARSPPICGFNYVVGKISHFFDLWRCDLGAYSTNHRIE